MTWTPKRYHTIPLRAHNFVVAQNTDDTFGAILHVVPSWQKSSRRVAGKGLNVKEFITVSLTAAYPIATGYAPEQMTLAVLLL